MEVQHLGFYRFRGLGFRGFRVFGVYGVGFRGVRGVEFRAWLALGLALRTSTFKAACCLQSLNAKHQTLNYP